VRCNGSDGRMTTFLLALLDSVIWLEVILRAKGML
jgi:hypothetical protein